MLESYIKSIQPVAANSITHYQAHWDQLVHPIRSLGRLEEIGTKVCSVLDELPHNLKKAVIIYSADNGITDENVSASPVELTAMLTNTYANYTLGVTALARSARADTYMYDLGVFDYPKVPGVISKRINNGTKNFMQEPAMTTQEALEAIQVGIEAAEKLIDQDYQVLGVGELGIGNTTTAATVISQVTQYDPKDVIGMGSGCNDEQLANKLHVMTEGPKIRQVDPTDPLDILTKVGGFDIAAMVGTILACAKHQIPVVIDGVITVAAMNLALMLAPATKDYILPSHIPYEPGAKLGMKYAGLEGYLDLEMRLGEGSGCPIMFKLIDSAIDTMNFMTSFEQAEIVLPEEMNDPIN